MQLSPSECGWETVGQNVRTLLPLLIAQLSCTPSFNQNHTWDARQWFTCVGVPRSEFGAVCGKWCAAPCLHLGSSRYPPITTTMTPIWKKSSLYWCAQVENRCGGAELCLSDPIRPLLHTEWVIQRWGGPTIRFIKEPSPNQLSFSHQLFLYFAGVKF